MEKEHRSGFERMWDVRLNAGAGVLNTKKRRTITAELADVRRVRLVQLDVAPAAVATAQLVRE
jgi:hypothetical protein